MLKVEGLHWQLTTKIFLTSSISSNYMEEENAKIVTNFLIKGLQIS